MKVELSEEADQQVREIDAWWREHRRAASDLFTDELDRALLALGEMPTLGTIYRADTRSVRRLLLRRTHYHLYFVQEDNSGRDSSHRLVAHTLPSFLLPSQNA